MEKLLRKVKCDERLPEKEGCYISILVDGRIYNVKYPEQTTRVFKVGEILTLNIPIEYWYEEVEVDSESLTDKFKTPKLLAKERYEKALNKLNDLLNQSFEGWSEDAIKGYKTLAATVEYNILSIAAGLNEEKI